ncbi:MAG: acyltransferase [Acidimicrobiales bacterium]|nr:acyltransferase [Acidimicrobiales bacterium]
MRDETTAAATRLDAVDGLRGAAALAVVVYHLTWRSTVLRDAVRPVAGHLDVGVEVFFVLSGFLIFGPFAKALLHGEERPAPLGYVARRAARIWPAYLVVLVSITVAGFAELDGIRGFLKHATLTYNYFDDRGGVGLTPAWTLVVEVSFYAFVPLVALAIAWTGRRVVGAAVICIAIGVVMQYHLAYDLDTAAWVRVLPPRMTLGVGMLLAAVHHQRDRTRPLTRALRRAAARPAAVLTVAVATYAALVAFVPATDPALGLDPGTRVVKELAQAMIAGCIALTVLFPSDAGQPWTRLLRHRTTAYLGAISYGVYLWHVPVMRLLRTPLVSENVLLAAAGWTAALAGTLGLAALSWHLVERPITDAVARRLRPPNPADRKQTSPAY